MYILYIHNAAPISTDGTVESGSNNRYRKCVSLAFADNSYSIVLHRSGKPQDNVACYSCAGSCQSTCCHYSTEYVHSLMYCRKIHSPWVVT